MTLQLDLRLLRRHELRLASHGQGPSGVCSGRVHNKLDAPVRRRGAHLSRDQVIVLLF